MSMYLYKCTNIKKKCFDFLQMFLKSLEMNELHRSVFNHRSTMEK